MPQLNKPVTTGEEYWVMRVIASQEDVKRWLHTAPMGEVNTLNERLTKGDLAYVNGELCEPIEVYTAQEDANIRAVKEHKRTGYVHKVVLCAEV